MAAGKRKATAATVKKQLHPSKKRSKDSTVKSVEREEKEEQMTVDENSDEEEEEDSSAVESSEEDEDELDQDSDSGDDEEDEEEENDEDEDDAEEVDDESKPKTNSKEAHALQKKLIKERKAAKPFSDVVDQSKRLWDKIRNKTGMKAAERRQLVEELFGLIRENVKALVFKHDMSRVIQTCVKYGSKAQREAICEELKGCHVELCKSPYGKYLSVKFFKYGTPAMKGMVLGELYGNVNKLIRHREAAYVVEDAFREYTNLQQQHALISEFYGPEYRVFKDASQDVHIDKLLKENPDKRNSIMQNLWQTIEGSVQKGSIGFTMVHRAMLEYMQHASEKEADQLLQLVKEQVYEFVHTKDGSETAMMLFAVATAKDRKVMWKSMRPYLVETAKDSYGHLVIVAGLDCTDDTVLTGKLVQAEFQGKLFKLGIDRYARRVLLYPLVGWNEPRYFSKLNRDFFASLAPLKEKTAKKDADVRRAELRSAFSPALLELVRNTAGELMAETLGSQVLVETLLYADGDKEAAIDAVVSAFSSDPAEDTHLIHMVHCSRALKTLVQNGHWDAKARQVRQSESQLHMAEKLKPVMEKHLESWACGDGAFVVLAVLEALSDDDKASLLAALRKHKKALKSSSTFKGTQRLLELL
ncbi:puf family RNA-binding protein [Schizosaccharomyces japonicus yFS275]|uniref:Puf family RNA-binding protein n=1 Tax=Schizosaccharomyces japonicus (strain yFS275 / FY16936) TaxID=402676 RepID=B6JYZ0_SCHJY|nr:puf family RNA-binding protein [Schizosaccharomyces japonicus yFS275]EEB06758.1 puf family RNA-binding protein [Schizosaccharomyces japonicus yFS275]